MSINGIRKKKDLFYSTNNDFKEIKLNTCKKIELLNYSSNNLTETYSLDVKSNILYYIAGYLVKKIDLECLSCKSVLYKKQNDHVYCKSISFSKFVNSKNRGGLVFASKSVFLIVQEAEKIFLFLTNNLKSLHVNNLNVKIIQHTIKKFSFDKTILAYLNCDNISLLERPHKLVLITLLTNKFLKLRLKSFGKMYSSDIMNPVSQRQKLSKLILFSNQ